MDNNHFKLAYSSVPAASYLGQGKPLSSSRISDVLNAILNSQEKYQIISFASAYKDEGCVEVAYELASSLSVAGKRVLIVDTEAGETGAFRELRYMLPTSINSALHQNALNNYVVLNLENVGICYTSFFKNAADKEVVCDADKFASFFKELKNTFDYIFVVSEDNTALSVGLATQVADASVVLVQAERTRRPVVAQLIENIRLNNGTILGLILNKRPLYIPPVLYRLLYR